MITIFPISTDYELLTSQMKKQTFVNIVFANTMVLMQNTTRKTTTKTTTTKATKKPQQNKSKKNPTENKTKNK